MPDIDKTFQCSLITPEGRLFDGRVTSVVIPAHDGEIGVLYNRAPLLCKMGPGRLRVQTPVEQRDWFVDGGFAHVIDNKVSILTQKALRPEEISATDAQARLEEALRMRVGDDDAVRLKAQAVARARAQLRMAK